MPISIGNRTVHHNAMKGYRKQRQYIYRHCHLNHVTPSYALIVGVCILMLPMLELATEHVQLATTCHMNHLHRVHSHHMTFSHKTLMLPSLNNVLPAIAFENRIAWSNIGYQSSHSRVCQVALSPVSTTHVSLSPTVPTGLGRRVVRVVVLLLLLMSGDIETNPGPVGQGDLKSLHCELHPVSDKWFSLGVQLKVPIEALKCIEAEHYQMSRRLLEMLTVWLKCTNPPPTWYILTEALKSPPVGERLLAQRLRDKYCPRNGGVTYGCGLSPPVALPTSNISTSDSQPETALTPPTELMVPTRKPSVAHIQECDSTLPPEIPPNPQLRSLTTPPPSPTDTELLSKRLVKQHVKQLESRFLHLVYCTYLELLDKEINVDHFYGWLVTLDVSRQREHQEFIESFEKGTDLSDLWKKLGSYWNFLNFDLLEHVVSGFGSEKLKKKMESYESDLQSFRKATRLCDFIACWPVRGQTPPESELREFVVRVDYHWDHCTLEDLDMLEGVITRKLFLPKFALRLRGIKPGSVIMMWLIPTSFVKGLQGAIESTSSEFFMKHKIESITVDGQECYSSLKTSKHSGHLQELSLPIPTVSITRPIPLHSVKLDTSDAETMTPTDLTPWLPTHLGDLKPTSPFYKSSSSGYYSGSSSTGYYSGSLSYDYYSGSSSFDYYSGGSSSDYYGGSSSSGWYSELEPHPLPTAAEKYVREKCVGEISRCVKLLPSVEQYLSKAEVDVDPSLPTKYKNYLSSTPAIRAALYTTFNAKLSAQVFIWSLHTESPPPTTMTELFTAFTLKTLVDHLSTHPVYHEQQLKVTAFSDLPTNVYKQFLGLCRIAYEGILNRQQLVFSAAHLPTGFAPLGLMQEVPQLYTEGRASTYHFIHLTLQEYLAAIHISQLPAREQTRLFQEHVNSDHLKMTMRFLAGLTKLANIPDDIMMGTKLNYFHFLFEANDILMITGTLGSDEMVVIPRYSWTPLDYYVTGHAISHSNCSWRLKFFLSSIDDGKFELFCQGCAAPGGTQCKGHITHPYFWGNDLTSKSVRSFVTIPPHMLQNMRELHLSDNKLDGSACDLLATAIPSMSRLEELWLGRNPIGSGGAVEVIKALCGSVVKQLLLYSTEIGEHDCEALCELLKSSHSLQHLDIDHNNLSSESVASIITGLSHNSSLTYLNISNSHFSTANVDSLASVLKYHSRCTLTELNLQDCHISSEGAVELAAALCKNTILKQLDLSNNPIGEHVGGVAAVAKMLVENKTLTTLNLEDCHISSEGAVELAVALCKNSTLKHLDLDYNPIGVEGASSMSDMLQHNISLKELRLRDDSVGKEGVHQLINTLKHNQTLRELWLPKKYKSETSDHRIQWW